MAMMNRSDDELAETTRRLRTSLDAQRFTFTLKQPVLSPPSTATAAASTASTFLLPILLPSSSARPGNSNSSSIETQPLKLQELSGKPDARSSNSAAALLPQEIANADLAIAVDRSFIETSSGAAARELKKFYEKMSAEAGPGRGLRLRTPYVITALPVNDEQRYRVSLRQDGDLSSEVTPNGSGRPPSIIPSIGGLINSVIAREGARNSHPGGTRQVLRRPRSISEPRDTNIYAVGASIGGFVNPFASTSRHSLDHRRPSMEDSPQGNIPHPYEIQANENSPFGPGVIYTEPTTPSSPQSTSFTTSGLREMQSFESGFTAKADDSMLTKHHPASQFLNKEPLLNQASMATTPYSTLVFDILQTYRGIPLPDRLSVISNEPTVKLSSTVTAVPSDDPRFVIWGEVLPDRSDELASSQDSHTDLSTTSHAGVSPRRRTSHARSGESPFTTMPLTQSHDKVIVAATIERWIAQLTSENESLELLHFFLTYRIYISGVDLCHLLICRFHWALEKPTSNHDQTLRAMVRARTYRMIRYWLLMWFKVDFATNATLCQVLTHWVNTLRKDPALRLDRIPDALDLVRRIKKLIHECKEKAERTKPVNGPEDVPSPSNKQQGVISERELETSAARHGNLSFNELSNKPLRGQILNMPPAGQTLTPVLGAPFAATASMDFPSPPIVIAAARGAPLPQHSATQNVLSQPLHMAILTQTSKPAIVASHPYAPIAGALPMQHSTISRVFVNTMGKLGRWKRVLNARSTPVQSQLDCSGVSSFDIEQLHPGDVQHNYHQLRLPGIPPRHLPPNAASEAGLRDSSYESMESLGETMPKPSSLLSTLDEGAESDSETKTPQPSLLVSKPSVLETDDNKRARSGHDDSASSLDYKSSGEGEDKGPHHSPTPEKGRESIDTESLASSIRDTVGLQVDPDQTLSLRPPELGGSHSDLSNSGHSTGTPTLNESSLGHAPSHETRSIQMSIESASVLSHEDEGRHSVASSDYNQRNSFFDSSEEDYGEPITGGAALVSTRASFVDMDDYESSDDHSAGEPDQPRRLPKRLPHGRDLKFVSRVDTVSSYSDPSVSRSSIVTEEEDTNAPNTSQATDPTGGKVFAWQLAYIDSEEDEPRDAEAALRRLEGHIDRDRQRRKETKVDGWLKKVRERKAQGRFYDDATDEDVQSSRGDPEDELRLETPPDEALIEDTQIEEPPASLMSNNMPSNEQEVDASVTGIERDTSTPIPEQMGQAPFPPLQHPIVPFPVHEDAVSTGPWGDTTMSQRTHKHSLSLTHKQSAFKITDQRPIPPSLPAPRESWVLVNRSLKVAQHLTMIESDLWRNVPFEDLVVSSPAIDPETRLGVLDWGEFMKQRAKTRNPNTLNSPRSINDLLIVRARFELTVMFTASEILLSRPNLRPLLVSKFIRIALKCYTLNNFSSLVAIITGLGLPPVQAATQRMPKGIGIYEMRILEGLRSFSSPEGNYHLIREAISTLVLAQNSTDAPSLPLNATTTSADASRACIPFIGIYLSQLYKYDKLPDYVDPTAPTEPVDEEPNGTLTQPRHPEVFASLAPLPSSMTLEPLINVHKQRLISNIVIDFIDAQKLTSKYKFVTERKLHQRCLKMRAVDMITLHQLSQADY